MYFHFVIHPEVKEYRRLLRKVYYVHETIRRFAYEVALLCAMQGRKHSLQRMVFTCFIVNYRPFLMQGIPSDCFFAGVCCGGLITLPVQVNLLWARNVAHLRTTFL